MWATVARVLLVIGFFAAPLYADVVRIDVQSRRDFAGGQDFGLSGPYEKISGKIFFAVDPDAARQPHRHRHREGAAKRRRQGRILLRLLPDQAEAHRARQRRRAVRGLQSRRQGDARLLQPCEPAASIRKRPPEIGDGFLMKQGFTLLWVGWQFDPPRRPGLVRLYAPIASDNGRPIRGVVRSDFVATERELDHSLADRDHVAYVVANPEDAGHVLTVRDSVDGARRVIPRDQWRFARPAVDKPNADGTPADSRLRGFISPAASNPERSTRWCTRRKIRRSWGSDRLPSATSSRCSNTGRPTPCRFLRARSSARIAFGVSQSGRFLRTYLYYGFNRDERDRKVFDGMIPHVAGGGRGSFNHRFAQPSRDGHPYLNFFYPTDIFPFTDVSQTDPQTGVTDGLLTHAGLRPNFCRRSSTRTPNTSTGVAPRRSFTRRSTARATCRSWTTCGSTSSPRASTVPRRSPRCRRWDSSATIRSITGGP